jgi:hypothetical protein
MLIVVEKDKVDTLAMKTSDCKKADKIDTLFRED